MVQHREILGPHHIGQAVLLRMHDGKWSNTGARIASVAEEITILEEDGGLSLYTAVRRENVKLKF